MRILYALVAILMLVYVASAWYTAAQSLAKQDIIEEKSSPEEYRLDETITRQESMKLILKLANITPESLCEGKFKDVSNDWGCKYIETALAKGFIHSSETFRPSDNITKAEAFKLVFKALNLAKLENSGDWKQDYMNSAFEYNLISMKDYDLDALATRGWLFEIADRALASGSYIEYKKMEKLMSDEAL